MDRSKHRALIVEDDADTREELEEILRSLDFEVVACDNKQTALQLVAEQSFCMAVLDLQIFGVSGANKGHVEHGRSLLREMRRAYPHHSGTSFTFPILVVSGFAREWADGVGVTQDGASAIIRKPPQSGEVSSRVRELLRNSGRSNHSDCATAPVPPTLRASDLELSIPGTRDRRRTHVMFGDRKTSVPERSLEVLLHLIIGRMTGTPVHKTTLGATDDQGFKGISVLRGQIQRALPTDANIIHNDYHGNYHLDEEITIGSIATGALVALKDRAITALVRQIEQLMSKSSKSDRNS